MVIVSERGQIVFCISYHNLDKQESPRNHALSCQVPKFQIVYALCGRYSYDFEGCSKCYTLYYICCIWESYSDGYVHSECAAAASEVRSDFFHTARNETRPQPQDLTRERPLIRDPMKT